MPPLAATGQHRQPAARIRTGQCLAQRAGRDPTPGERHPRPAQPGLLLRSENQIDSTAEGVAVDEERTPPSGYRCVGHRSRQHRRTGTSPATEHGQHPATGIGALQALAQCIHQKPLSVGQLHDLLGSNADRAAPQRFVGISVSEHQNAVAAGQSGLGAAAGGGVIEQHQRGAGPRQPGPGGVDGELEVTARGRSQSQYFFLQCTRGDQREHPHRGGGSHGSTVRRPTDRERRFRGRCGCFPGLWTTRSPGTDTGRFTGRSYGTTPARGEGRGSSALSPGGSG